MELRTALKEQYHAGLAMLADCVEKCPPEAWIAGQYPRLFWRIAFHAAFFTHLYLGQGEDSFRPWPERPADLHEEIWNDPAEVEPFELPESAKDYSQAEMLNYIAYVDQLIDTTVDTLDLDTEETGFRWYKNISKLSHQLMNLRHLQGHVGQLSELLMAQGVDTEWIAKGGSR